MGDAEWRLRAPGMGRGDGGHGMRVCSAASAVSWAKVQRWQRWCQLWSERNGL
jgi:hypothetical protein